jgi:hypothetical protein
MLTERSPQRLKGTLGIGLGKVHPLAPMMKLVFIGGSLYRYQSKNKQEWNRGRKPPLYLEAALYYFRKVIL